MVCLSELVMFVSAMDLKWPWSALLIEQIHVLKLWSVICWPAAELSFCAGSQGPFRRWWLCEEEQYAHVALMHALREW